MRIASRRRSVPDLDVALRGEIVNLVGLRFLNEPDQVGRVGQIAVVQEKARLAFVRVVV